MAEIYDQYLPPVGRALMLRDGDKTMLRGTVVPAPPATADLVFTICRVDGNPAWVSTTDPGTGQTTATVGPMCTRCATAQAANPTLFNAVLRMINASRWLWTSLSPE